MGQSLDQKLLVLEGVFYLGLDVHEMRREGVTFFSGAVETNPEVWLMDYPEGIEQSLTVIQIFVFEIENAN